MTRALLLQPPIHLDFDFIDYPPLITYATAAMAAALRRHECDVEVLDAGCMPGSGFDRTSSGWCWGVPDDDYLAALRSRRAEVVVVSQSVFQYTQPSLDVLRRVIQTCRSWTPSPLIVLADQSPGGMHRLDIEPDERLSLLPKVDVLATYESDAAIGTILAGYRSGSEIPRVIDGYAENLAETADPAFDLIDIDAYQAGLRSASRNRDWLFRSERRTLPFLTSRGCPYRCNFCFPEAAWRKGAKVGGFRAFSVERIEKQLATVTAMGVDHLVILDATINGDPERFDRLITLFQQGGFTIDVPNGMRADLLTDQNVGRLKPMLQDLSISAESGDPEVVKRVVGKNLDLGNIKRVAESCHREGLALSIHWMLGQPGETMEAIKRTLSLAWNLFSRFDATPLVQFATPFPGTRLYREAVEKGYFEVASIKTSSLPAQTSRRLVFRPPGLDIEKVRQLRHRFVARVEAARQSSH
jgi:organic radical activating enzyme